MCVCMCVCLYVCVVCLHVCVMPPMCIKAKLLLPIPQCLDTLVQFGGFLSTHLNPDDYNYKVPPLDVLGLEYNVPADTAFFMLRPLIKSSVNVRTHVTVM